MATNYSINIKRFNGTDHDTLYPMTTIDNVKGGQKKITSGTLIVSTNWEGEDPYTQSITIPEASDFSKIDIQPDYEMAQILMDAGVTFMQVENSYGNLTLLLLGGKPTVGLSLQYTVTEVR